MARKPTFNFGAGAKKPKAKARGGKGRKPLSGQQRQNAARYLSGKDEGYSSLPE